MEFHERLVELRKEKGFTRENFANYLGISKYTLRNYEMGKTEPGHVFLKYLSSIFHVSIDYLLCVTDDKTPPAKQLDFSVLEINHIKKYRALDAPGQEHVDTVLQWETDRMAQLLSRDLRVAELETRPTTVLPNQISELEPDYLAADAAHAITGSSEEEVNHDDDIMDNDDEWD